MNILLKKQGFTIIETLIAIAILMIAIAGPLTIAHKGLLAAVYAHDQVTASYLAQDAMEYLKNIKDNNIKNGGDNNWLGNLTSCTSANLCAVDTINGSPDYIPGPESQGIDTRNCASGSCVLSKDDTDSNTGYNHQGDGSASQFTRYFYIIPPIITNSNEAKIIVIVKWKNGVIDNQVLYESEIFNVTK